MINVVNDFLDDLRGGRMTDAPIVTVEQGQLQGRLVSSPSAKPYYSFQGIPYAKPPLGSLRFKAPEPAEPWEGIRDATSEGNVSAQTDVLFTNEYVGDENCLFLNVYTPDINATNLPVMIWIHGGGFRFGNGNSSLYGPDYLVEKDVIVVTLNYRCGVLGFLSLNIPEAPGNAGLKDCVQALRWVKENIKSFGGDPSNLTVFGESAGGAAVTLLTASPLSKNLINKAIIESGTALCPWALQKNPVENARKLSQILGNDATDPQEIYEFLSTTPAKELVEAHDKLAPVNEFTENSDNPFCVVIEKEFPGEEAIFTEPFIDILTSGRVADIPVIIGANTLEFTFPPKEDIIALIPQELNIEKNSEQAKDIGDKLKKLYFKDGSDNDVDFYDFISDRLIKVDTYRYVQYLAKVVNKPIYYYNFDYSGELNIGKRLPYGIDVGKALHMDECGYLFKNELVGDVTPSEEDGIMKERMVRLWTNFAKFGNPTPEQDSYLNVTWSPVTQDTLNCLNLSNELTLLANPDKEKMDFWDDLYIKHFRIWEQPKTNTVEIQEPQIPVSNTPEILVSNDTDTAVSNDTETAVSNVPIIIETTEPIIVETSVTTEEDNQGNIIQTFTESVTITSESTTSENTYVETVVESNNIEENRPKIVQEIIEVERPKIVEDIKEIDLPSVKEMVENANNNSGGNYINNHQNGFEKKVRTSNEIKMASSPNGAPKDVIRANDPPEDDLPKNIGVNKFVNFFESLGGKK